MSYARFCEGESDVSPLTDTGLTDEQAKKSFWFCESFFRITALLNDTFDYASADGHEFTSDTGLPQAIELFVKHGHNGLIAAASVIRGQAPLPPYRTAGFELAMEDARKWIDPEDDFYETELWRTLQKERENQLGLTPVITLGSNVSSGDPMNTVTLPGILGAGEIAVKSEDLKAVLAHVNDMAVEDHREVREAYERLLKETRSGSEENRPETRSDQATVSL